MRIGRLKIWLRIKSKQFQFLGFSGIMYVRCLSNPKGSITGDGDIWNVFGSQKQMKTTILKEELVGYNYGFTTCWFWIFTLTFYTPRYLVNLLSMNER